MPASDSSDKLCEEQKEAPPVTLKLLGNMLQIKRTLTGQVLPSLCFNSHTVNMSSTWINPAFASTLVQFGFKKIYE